MVVDGEYFVDADRVPIDTELETKEWFALPSLVDAHAHIGANTVGQQAAASDAEAIMSAQTNMWAQLASGVFVVFDKGGRSDALLRMLKEPPKGRPTMSMAGQMIATPGGYYDNFAYETDPNDLADYVASVSGSGAQWIKLVGDWPRKGQGAVPNFTQEQMAAAVSVAHRAGLRVAIHTNAPATPAMAVNAGVDSIEHGLFLSAEDLRVLGARRGAWVPTIRAMEGVGASLGPDSSGGRLFAEGLANVRELLASAPAMGVQTMCGTDLFLPHGGVAAEAIRMVEYGMSTTDALASVTNVGLRYAGRVTGFSAGMPASAVFVESDPRDDITVLARPKMVLYHGRVISRGATDSTSAGLE